MNKSKSFILYSDYRKHLDLIKDDHDFRLLIEAVFDYHKSGNAPSNLSPMAKMAFSFIQSNLDRDIEEYNKKCAINATNGAKGGRPKKEETEKSEKSERFSEKRTQAKKAYNNNNTNTDNNNNTDSKRSPNGQSHQRQAADEDGNPISFYYENVPYWYNNILGDQCPRCLEITNERKKTIKARHSQFKNKGGWIIYFNWITHSPFLMGQQEGTQDREPFTADFDWLLRPKILPKVIEGKYHSRNGIVIEGKNITNYFEFKELMEQKA